MIRRPTVLILGAGASAHLNYPSSALLRQRIIEELGQPSNTSYKQLLELQFKDADIVDFVTKFRYSGKISIDSFLEHQSDNVKKIGRCAIAQTLIRFENEGHLFSETADHVENNWYYHLFKLMNSSFNDFHENNVTFITFNYDRSLEHFLFTALKHTYSKDDKQTEGKLSGLNIIHVHGVLGDLPWQTAEGRSYRSHCPSEMLLKSAEKIRIMSDDIADVHFLKYAWQKLNEAELICCLGFGYDSANMDRLRLNDLHQKKVKFQGTCFGVKSAEKDMVNEYFSNGRYAIQLDDKNFKVSDYLKEKVSLR